MTGKPKTKCLYCGATIGHQSGCVVLLGKERQDTQVRSSDLLSGWFPSSEEPGGSYECDILVGEHEDTPDLCHRMIGFYSKLGWMICQYPANLYPSELRRWGCDMEVRYWKKCDERPST